MVGRIFGRVCGLCATAWPEELLRSRSERRRAKWAVRFAQVVPGVDFHKEAPAPGWGDGTPGPSAWYTTGLAPIRHTRAT